MKNIFIPFFLLFSFCLQAQKNESINDRQAQTASVEKSIFGIQTGFLGIWVNEERKLSNSIALRLEIGLDAGIIGNSYSNENYVEYVFTPVINLEPRWYYNFEKRLKKGRKINNNSGNFVALKMSFNPDLFVISNRNDIKVPNQLFIIPKWGIKRGIGQHFTYEAGIGIGYHHVFENDYYWVANKDVDIAMDLHLRIGYVF